MSSILEDSSFTPWIRAMQARKTLLRQGAKRFGPPPAEVTSYLAALGDLDEFDRLSERLLDVASCEELLAKPKRLMSSNADAADSR